MPLSLIFIQPGNYTIDDNGIPGDNISVIRDGNGVVIFTFGHPADALNFTVSTPGVNITVNFTDSMNAANFTIGSTNPDPMVGPPQSPDSIVINNIQTTGTVTLVSNGTITEAGSDVAPDIFAGALVLSAVSGVGSPSNPIETRTGLFEAETTTGGIAISNIGSVQIGGVTADVDGIDVATSGDILFTTVGSIFLTEANTVTAGEVVHGGGTSGNIVITASGANSDIIGNVDNGAVTAPRGSIQLTAGRDIQLGTIGADFNNDMISNNSLTLIAGRDILIDGFADILSDNFGLDTGGDLTFTAGRNIGILNLAGVSASVTASGSGGGDAILTTGVNGALTVNGPGSFALGSTSGNVVVRADRILIDGGSGISAPSGTITISPFTPGRDIFLGSAGDAGAGIELSDLELNRIFAPNLTLGSNDTGQIRLIAPVNVISPGTPENLLLRASSILIQSNFTVVEQLTLSAANDVFQTAVSVIDVGVLTVNVDSGDTDAGFGDTGTLAGTVSAAVGATLNGAADGDTLNGSGFGETLFGFGGNDTLRGNGGNDTLDGGTGNDTMLGGLGNDFFFVDSVGDVVNEAIGEGTADRIFSSVSYALAAGTEIEMLTPLSFASTNAIDFQGNAFSQSIFGNAGVNNLDGGGGGDILVGLAGNDNYFIRSGADRAVETVGNGSDRVYALVSFTLEAGSHVELLTPIDFLATTAINLTGNALNQTIFGNAGANSLDSGGGGDSMLGLGGNDFYFVRSAADRAVETAGNGTGDRVFAAVTYSLEAGSEIEILSTIDNLAVTAINLTGNSLQQFIFGNAGANTLDSGGGNDIMSGFGGNDFYFIRGPGDRAVEAAAAGNDRVFSASSFALEAGSSIEMMTPYDFASTNAFDFQGNALSQSIFGNAGANSLDGGGGGDTLVGLGGNDNFFVRNSADRAVETVGNGNDRVFALVSFTLEAGSHVEMITPFDFASVTAINLTGNELVQTIFGNDGANVLDGKAGSDTLVGLGGADRFAFTTTLGASNVDTISGFVAGVDEIALDDAIFTGLVPGALPAGAFRTGSAAADADDRIIYDPVTGGLYFDVDGTGAAAQVLFAALSPGLALAAGDFVVI